MISQGLKDGPLTDQNYKVPWTDLQRGRGLGGREPEFREFFAEIHRTGPNFQR